MLLCASMPVQAQTGNLLYSPNLNPIPTGSTVLYIAVAVVLALLGVYTLRKQPPGSSMTSVGTFLLLGVIAVSELWIGTKVHALVGSTQSFLSDPQGGSVVVVTGAQNFSNTSGVPMLIATLQPPCAVANTAGNACEIGTVLMAGDSCDTDFTCP